MEDFIKEHWQWFTLSACLWLVGHFMETSVFTKANAAKHKALRWGRESMELHAPAAGVVVGAFMGNAWGGLLSGMGSLLGWGLISWALSKFGFDTRGVRLPGESRPPDAPPRDEP